MSLRQIVRLKWRLGHFRMVTIALFLLLYVVFPTRKGPKSVDPRASWSLSGFYSRQLLFLFFFAERALVD
jgi:hypothetical protein